jgi:arylsulfatase A-like enzyme
MVRMMRPAVQMVGLIVLSLLAACRPPADFSRETLLPDLLQRRLEQHSEWRQAWRMPMGTGHVLRVPAPSTGAESGATLRLGVLEGEPGMGQATLRVYAGDRLIHRIRTGKTPQWADYRIPLPEISADAPCRIVKDTEQILWVGPCEVIAGAGRPNVLLYLVDTLRQDHLGCYGYARDTSPHVDALAGESVVFTQLMPQSSWTKPSVASMLTSTYPNVHGAQDRPDMLREGLPTLAGALRDAGYETHGMITNTNLVPLWGFGEGFSRYVDVDSADWVNCDDAKVVDVAIRTLESVQGRPWFLYVHTMGPHDPYEAPGGCDQKYQRPSYPGSEEEQQRARTVDRYDGEISYSDAQFQRLLEQLKALGMYDNTFIVFASDHGEEFWEHGGATHGKTLYEEMLRVPLLIKMPGGQFGGERRDGLVEMVDLAPTLLDVLGVPPEPEFQGRSFRALLETGAQAPRIGYAALVNLAASARTAKTTEYKYLTDVVAHQESWFDLVRDPGEKSPAAAPAPAAEALRPHTRKLGLQGAEGLHILMTCGEEKHTVTGSIEAANLGPFDLHYYEWKSQVTASENKLEFRFLTKHPEDVSHQRDVWHTQLAEQDNAHLRIPMPPETEFRLHLEVDGHPVPPELLTLGTAAETQLPGPDAPLHPLDILAGADTYDPAGLPRKFAIYVWYVTPSPDIPEETLDPKIRDNLKALGYL